MEPKEHKFGESSCCDFEIINQNLERIPYKLKVSESASSSRCKIPGGIGFLGTNSPIIPIDGESPLRKTNIKPFEIDTYAVTNELFAKFINETGYVTDAERHGNSFVFE